MKRIDFKVFSEKLNRLPPKLRLLQLKKARERIEKKRNELEKSVYEKEINRLLHGLEKEDIGWGAAYDKVKTKIFSQEEKNEDDSNYMEIADLISR